MPTFDRFLQSDFVSRHSNRVNWRRASKCPCSSLNQPDANRATLDCPLCDGFGFIYDPPVALLGMLVGNAFMKQLLDVGIANPGDMVLSLNPNEINLLSDYDIINFAYAPGEPYEGDTLVRDKKSTGDPDDLSFTPVQIINCMSISGDRKSVLNYVQGIDFTISGRSLTWLHGKGPQRQTPYQIKYTARFDWMVSTPPALRFEDAFGGSGNLGQRVLLRKREVPIPIFNADGN